jgi:hypothetical protein
LNKNAGEEWIIGYTTIVDFFLAGIVSFFEDIWPEQIAQFNNLVRSRNNLYNLP